MPIMSLDLDRETDQLLEELKEFYGVKTKAAVIRRSLALAKIARRKASGDKSVVLSTRKGDNEAETVMLAG